MSSSFLTNECSHIFGLCLQRHSRVGNSSPHSGLLGQLKQRTAEPQHIHQNQTINEIFQLIYDRIRGSSQYLG